MPQKKRMTKRKQVRRRRVARPRTRIASKTHLLKRHGEVIVVTNAGTTGAPLLAADGAGSAVFGTVIPSATFGPAYDVGMSLQFWLDSVLANSEITAMFDRYKITGVKLDVMYQQNTASSSGSSASILPVLYSSYDFDDATPPSLASDVTTRGYVRTHVLNANRTFSIFLKPRMPQVVNVLRNEQILSVNATNVRSQWIDSAVSDVPHYGVKFWLSNLPQNFSENATCQLRIQPTYYLALKDTH